MANGGWIKWHRKSIDNPLFKNPLGWHLFEYCCLKANHEPERFIFNQEEIFIDRGQFVFGRKQAAMETGIHPSTIYRRIMSLERNKMITVKSNNKFSVITVQNYSEYQAKKPEVEQQVNNKRTTKEQQLNTNKKEKNDKNSKKKHIDPRVTKFFGFWNKKFFDQTGDKYTFNGAKEGSLIKKMLAVDTFPRLEELIEDFWDLDDSFVDQAGRTIGVFYSQLNKLKSEDRVMKEYKASGRKEIPF